MNFPKKNIKLFVFLVFGIALNQRASATTRQELENKLFENNQEIQAFESQVLAQENLKKSLYSSYLPSLNAVGGWAKNKTDEDDQKGQVGYLQGTANLFSGFRDQSNIEIEDQKLNLARLGLETQKRKIREELTDVLTTMIGLHQLEKILDEEFKVTQIQKQMAAKKVSAGLTSTVDNFEFDLRESEIQIQRRNIVQSHEEAHQKLNALFNEEVKDEDINNIDFLTLEELKKNLNVLNFKNHPLLQKSQTEKTIAELEKRSVNSEFLPKLDLSYSFGRLTPTETDFKYNESQVALLITIPLFSGLETVYKRKSAISAVSARERELTQVGLNTKSQFERLKTKFSELTDLYQINEKKLVYAEKYYNLTLAEYKRGVKNSPDLVGATERFFDSKKKKIELQKELELVRVQLNNFN